MARQPDYDGARDELRRYIEQCGGADVAARRLGRSSGGLKKLLNGERRVSPELALEIELDSTKLVRRKPALGPVIDRGVLIWGRL